MVDGDPLAFKITTRLDLLLRAYQQAGTAEFTDDASLVELIGGQVQVVDGDPLAFKITTRLDLLLAQAIVSQ